MINLAWTDNSGNETGFRVERRLNPAGAWGTITTTAANAISFSDNTPVANTTYDYRVFAINGGGDSAPSNTATTTTLPNPPAAPTVLTATPVSQTQINLAWTDNSSDETGFRIERRVVPAGTFATVTTTAPNAIAYSDNSLTASTTYEFRVIAVNAGGESTPSNVATETTLPPPPTAPSALGASTVSTTQIDLSWADNSFDETAFHIERSPNGATGWSEINTVLAGVTTYSDNTGVASTTYYYRVRANGPGGFSTYSNTDNATTLPDAPSGLGATAISSSQINLSWTDNSSDETAFHIERSPNGTTGWAQINTTGAGVTVYSDLGLDPNTPYFYRVRANGVGGILSVFRDCDCHDIDCRTCDSDGSSSHGDLPDPDRPDLDG